MAFVSGWDADLVWGIGGWREGRLEVFGGCGKGLSGEKGVLLC